MSLLEIDVSKRFVLVDYPGLVLNPSVALESLGGEQEVSKALEERNKRLNLYLRPKDSEAHPVCVDRQDYCGVLLRVRRRKKKNGAEVEVPPEPCEVSVLGITTTIYACTGLADFQFLPPGLHSTTSGETKHLTKIEDVADFSLLDVDTDVLHLPSAAFARQDKAGSGLRPAVKGRTDRGQTNHIVDFSVRNVPSEPAQLAGSPALLDLLRELFSQRPIWSNLALTNVVKKRLKVNQGPLKVAIRSVAYYFSSGPWRLLWIRLGYDPRLHKEAAMYQCLDFRPGRSSVFRGDEQPSKRTVHTSRGKRSHMTTLLEDLEDDPGADGSELSHEFHSGQAAGQRNVLMQFCDVHVPAVRDVLQSRLQDSCMSDRDGWFASGTMEEVRSLMLLELQHQQQPIIKRTSHPNSAN